MYASTVKLDQPNTVYHLPTWNAGDERRRLAFLRDKAESWGRDPRIRDLTAKVLQDSGVPPRRYADQAAAILRWVQETIYYMNEPGEILQSPVYTVTRKYGDCDDLALLTGAMFTALRLPWRFVLSGVDPQTRSRVRYIEGQGMPQPRVGWAHIYVMVGNHPFKTTEWKYAEPTLKGAPLGWDVVAAASDPNTRKQFPELGDSAISVTDNTGGVNWKALVIAIGVNVVTSVAAGLMIRAILDKKK